MALELHSSAFYQQFEALSDGVIDLSQETGGQIERLVKARVLRGKSYDPRSRKLQLLKNDEAALEN